MKVAITVEGQRGLTWDKWKAFAPAVEDFGFSGLYRSDHFVDADPPDLPSLELWVSLTWLADHTRKIQIGSLVTPFSFRHPVHTARMAKDLDDLSGGRFVLGVGAGWEGAVREHTMFGFDLLPVKERFIRFEEGLEIVSRLLKENQPVTFTGRFYHLQEARLLPFPKRLGGPPIMVGGNGSTRLLSLAAKYADEWNAIHRTPIEFAKLNNRLNMLLDKIQRPRQSIKRSQMMGLMFGESQPDLVHLLGDRQASEMWEKGVLVGCASQIVDQLNQLAEAGVVQVILQWSDLENLRKLESFSHQVLSQVITH
jgi:alkanesulfonate monooxygenase SsuD/methylene tetrahydromethanopterin reductase-like flavin-dependent oxidoreductase (luciferase family)